MILDEIKRVSSKKLIFTLDDGSEVTIDTKEAYTKLSDIEKILGEMKCSNCKYLNKYDGCDSGDSDVDCVSSPDKTYCNCFEVRE